MLIALAITLILLAILPDMSLMGAAFLGQSVALPSLQFPVKLSLPNQFWSEEELSKGKFLIASRNLIDPNFSETVILLIDYGWNGATGLIINRPSKVKLSSMLPKIKGLNKRADTFYIGGPVARRQILLLIRSNSQPEKSHRIFKNIYVSPSRTVLQRMIENEKVGERFRVFAGYAAWAPGQLEREMLRGDWRIMKADTETIFEKAPLEIWPELILRSLDLWIKVQKFYKMLSIRCLFASFSKQIVKMYTY